MNWTNKWAKKPRTKIVAVAFQIGFFLEPLFHCHYIEVPVVKHRKR